ncbi:MAG: S9 family peptidase [Anaerolineae bacterium]
MTTDKTQQNYGLWSSAIVPEMIGDSLRLNDALWDSDGQTLVWSERRGTQTMLVAKTGHDALRELIDSLYNPSGGVGYGGGEFTVHDGVVYFVNKGRLYRLPLSGDLPQAITPQFGGMASPKVSADGRWLTFVHTYEGQDVLALVNSHGQQWPQKIASGSDFLMQPAWSPDGTQIAYIAWDHPQMPWNSTELRVISLSTSGTMPHAVQEEIIVSGQDVAIAQPEFSPDGRYLAYISDASGWLHLYLYDRQTRQHQQITQGEIEHGIPQWVQGNHTYGWSADSSGLTYIRHEAGFYSIWRYTLADSKHIRLEALDDYTHIDRVAVSSTGQLALIASSATIPTRIITYNEQNSIGIARRSTTEAVMGADELADCEAITWKGHDGETVHGLYYAPHNPRFEGIGKPPLMVLIHGGPTSQRNASFDLEVQFFTTRGFAVLQVNHRGSTGYGKAYMNQHQGNWGVYDVQDSITGAQHLSDAGLVDPNKRVIMGGSAGGYTALQALVDAPGFFKAGVVSYGVANQFSLVMDTHKFEERYSEWLLGALPESAEKYRDRSPLFHADRIRDALILFQGTEDKVVPKNQSDTIVNALKQGGVTHRYVVYDGEGHGFRNPETRVDFYNQIMQFLKETVIFT